MYRSTRSFFWMWFSSGVYRAVSDSSIFSSFMAGFLAMISVYWSIKVSFDLKNEASQ